MIICCANFQFSAHCIFFGIAFSLKQERATLQGWIEQPKVQWNFIIQLCLKNIFWLLSGYTQKSDYTKQCNNRAQQYQALFLKAFQIPILSKANTRNVLAFSLLLVSAFCVQKLLLLRFLLLLLSPSNPKLSYPPSQDIFDSQSLDSKVLEAIAALVVEYIQQQFGGLITMARAAWPGRHGLGIAKKRWGRSAVAHSTLLEIRPTEVQRRHFPFVFK